ncbi:MAG: serine/threonine protein kinase [Deltaproteobacteria bacterium]|nr:MAG: serine/threonine protein kinase [Deltaproteobacteria bacterium]
MAEKKLNCWEVTRCGREPGGRSAEKSGVCPAAADISFDGINSGVCGGRICWAVAGTFCGGCIQGSFAEKRASCLECDFYQMVQEEEGMANRQTKFLQFITPDGSRAFVDRLRFIHIKAGQRFVVQGEVEHTAYIIQRGSCLVVVEKDGVLHPVDHYGEGDIVGGLGILTGEPRRAHVEAETDMDLWEMTREQFDEISSQDPDLLSFITELVADRLDSRRPTAYRTIGKYVATDIIGRGAFSIVYRGKHRQLGKPVVIKMMRHDMALYPDFLENFRNEAKIIASLNHDHIIKVYDFDERYRTLFIIMEYVPGRSLKEMIRRPSPLPAHRVLHFLSQIISALDYAHRGGIIHRDVNPSNIIIQPNDQVKILDFGLACPTGTEDFANTGTAHYMAPEQITGDPVDPRTDIYALGIMAYEMVVGRRPFPERSCQELLELHLSCDVPDPKPFASGLPDGLGDFIRRAGRRDPARRYQNAREAGAAVERLLDKRSASVKAAAFGTNCNDVSSGGIG